MITDLLARDRVDVLAAAGLSASLPCDARMIMIIDAVCGEMHLKFGCAYCGKVCGPKLRV